MMNGNGQQYAFRSPRSIGKQPNSQKEIIGKMDLTPKKKINFDLSKPIQLKG